jgi:hypothetical protein
MIMSYVAFSKKIFSSLEELQGDLDEWMDYYNGERTHQGKMVLRRLMWNS